MKRDRGAIGGLFIGDALAMPAHWYYDVAALRNDYGIIRDYRAPRSPHPDSILWRSGYEAPGPKGEILHDQAIYWGERGIHYHQFLEAGDNTLTALLCRLLVDSLNDCGGYDADDYLRRYIAFMTTPGSHRDTYVEECHRHFFTRYAAGVDPRRCGAVEKHIGGLVGVVPIVVFHREQPDRAREAALEHLSLTHRGTRMADAARLYIDLLLAALHGEDLRKAIPERLVRSPYAEVPLEQWLPFPDGRVVGEHLSTACYVEDALPATLYFALKYADRPREGLIANTNVGGDNVHRGALLGALLGATNGWDAFPAGWRDGLRQPPPTLRVSVGDRS